MEVGLNAQSEEEAEYEDPSDDEKEDVNPFVDLNQGRNQGVRPGNQLSSQNFGMQIKIPEFNGKAHLDEFIDWLHTIERIIYLKDLTEGQKVKLVAIRL